MLFQFCLFVLTTPCFSVWCVKEGLRIVSTCCSPVKENFCLIPECLSKRGQIYQTKLTAAVYSELIPICRTNPTPNPRKPSLLWKNNFRLRGKSFPNAG